MPRSLSAELVRRNRLSLRAESPGSTLGCPAAGHAAVRTSSDCASGSITMSAEPLCRPEQVILTGCTRVPVLACAPAVIRTWAPAAVRVATIGWRGER
ncbi:hypothetical protein [Amycolatopsis silviterrae]|uniref:Uncharacterized protein n=1 Tax=Amycolatopsis silviterrae TaxID=1656914 RepID=A0ABW5HMN0_9PSEU